MKSPPFFFPWWKRNPARRTGGGRCRARLYLECLEHRDLFAALLPFTPFDTAHAARHPPPPGANPIAALPGTPMNALEARSSTWQVDLDGDGLADKVTLDSSGAILFRRGLPGADKPFALPVVLNSKTAVGANRPARDLAVLHTGTGSAVAAADALFDPALSSPNHAVFTVSLYRVAADGSVTRTTAFSSPLAPRRIAAADLAGNGLDDLVVVHAHMKSVTIAVQTAPGQFASPITLAVGIAPSDVFLVDVDEDGRADVVLSDQATGDVAVLLNKDLGRFLITAEDVGDGADSPSLDSNKETSAVAAPAPDVGLAAIDFRSNEDRDVAVNRSAQGFTAVVELAGAIARLAPDCPRRFETAAVVALDEFNAPGVLWVLESDGEQVLVAAAGPDMVSGFTLLALGPPPAPEQKPAVAPSTPPPGGAVSVSSPIDAPLVLVVTVVADTLSPDDAVAAAVRALQSQIGESADGQALPAPPATSSLTPSVEHVLRKLKLNPPTEAADLLGPLSLRAVPDEGAGGNLWSRLEGLGGARVSTEVAASLLEGRRTAQQEGAPESEESTAAREGPDGELILLAALAVWGLAWRSPTDGRGRPKEATDVR